MHTSKVSSHDLSDAADFREHLLFLRQTLLTMAGLHGLEVSLGRRRPHGSGPRGPVALDDEPSALRSHPHERPGTLSMAIAGPHTTRLTFFNHFRATPLSMAITLCLAALLTREPAVLGRGPAHRLRSVPSARLSQQIVS